MTMDNNHFLVHQVEESESSSMPSNTGQNNSPPQFTPPRMPRQRSAYTTPSQNKCYANVLNQSLIN